ncbi:NACHT domain-containing protein [Mycena sanguinolenta]|uniref:NACHT domain-containing protein n=1 Tax=Mycena sanguinolenta TaxID=230812 RepID=A0A8H6ZDP8_9AGAR|nr:NACHT domain-containing protein [Mycena sanguinolenta]
MPLITSSSGFQFYGGNFYDVAGDMNIHSTQPAIELGPQRNMRKIEAARVMPYSRPRRPPLLDRPNGSCIQLPHSAAVASLSGPPQDRNRSGLSPIHPARAAIEYSSIDDQDRGRSPQGDPNPLDPPPISLERGAIEYSSTHSQDRDLSLQGTRNQLGPPPIYPERRDIEHSLSHDQNLGRSPQGDSTPSGPPPIHLDRRAIEYSSAHDGRLPPQGGVLSLSFPAQDHGTHINIGGDVNHIEYHMERGGCSTYVYTPYLIEAAAADAFHDSAERFPQPRCHPETRTEILEDLWRWSSNTDSASSVFWLHGPAGAGKSAIAQSFCQKLAEHHRLGASFFFKRGHPSRGSGNKLFPTVAYQLSLALSTYKQAVSRIIEHEPSIISRELPTQLRKLIVEPSRKTIHRTLVIVIDGLDESEGKDIQCEILRLIGSAIREGRLSLRFFFASRPEPHICQTFASNLHQIHCAVNINQSFDDVRKYLLGEFARIHSEHHETMARVHFPWPSPDVVESLVQKASGYFVYASISKS